MYSETKHSKVWGNTAMSGHISLDGISISATSPVYMEHFGPGFKDRYEAYFPETSITNIVFGKTMQFEHWGHIKLKCWNTGATCDIQIEKSNGVF